MTQNPKTGRYAVSPRDKVFMMFNGKSGQYAFDDCAAFLRKQQRVNGETSICGVQVALPGSHGYSTWVTYGNEVGTGFGFYALTSPSGRGYKAVNGKSYRTLEGAFNALLNY